MTLFNFQTRPNSARFQLPLPEPDRRLSPHPALTAIGHPLPGLLPHPRQHWYCVRPFALDSFPVSWALPQAVEYYESSVAMGLSAFRRSLSYPSSAYDALRHSFRSFLLLGGCPGRMSYAIATHSMPYDRAGRIVPSKPESRLDHKAGVRAIQLSPYAS
jgi:hypothetical protein